MAKPNFKDLLLAKGEKFGLIAGGGLALLLMILGVMSIASADSPASKAKEFESHASRLDNGVRQPGEGAPPLPDWVQKAGTPTPIKPQEFALAGPPFEPLYTPDPRRQNPKVLGIVSWQVDLLRAPMRALDIQENADGSFQIGAIVNKPVPEKDRKKVQDIAGDALKNLFGGRNAKPKPQPKGVQPAGIQPPGAQPPGTQPPMGAMPPMGGAGGGQPPRGGGDNIYGMGSESMGAGGPRDDKAVEYKTPQEIQEKGLPLAETVYPARLLLVHALFPLKDQLEEIKTALRLQTLQEAIAQSSIGGQTGPVFDGFEVRRKTVYPDGKESEWAMFDHEYEYATKLRTRMWASQPDSGFLTYFLRPYSQKLAAPLPQLADQLGIYPNIRIPEILAAEKKMREAGRQPITPTEWDRRFGKPTGEDNPYAPLGSAGYSTAGSAQPPMAGGGGTLAPRGQPPGGMPPGGMPPPGPPGGQAGSPVGIEGSPPRPGQPGGGVMVSTNVQLDADYVLLRFIDPDVKPGHSYQYQIRVKMKNPNFKKFADVARQDDANIETLTGLWVGIGEQVNVPHESFLYASDPAKYLEHATSVYERYGKEAAIRNILDERAVQEGKKAVVQVQSWMEQIRLDGGKTEPIGTWVVADIPVSAGEFIGKRQLVELPLWSAGQSNYVLRELTGGVRVFGMRDQKNQPKGWPVNFRTQSILVDFEGGKTKSRVSDREVSDEASSEMLILLKDGRMLVRSSGSDSDDDQRKARSTVWDDWLKRVRDRKGGGAGGTNPNDPNYGRPGGAPGGGTGSPP